VKIALRDDDTCYFTSPETLERVYHDVWDRLPVCLATVPFAIGYERKGIPQEHWTSGIAFPLHHNGAIAPFLKEQMAKGRVTIALHGYTHEDFMDGFEFQAAPDPERRVREGLAYLHSTLGQSISIFVPPHNALSKRGLAAVSEAGLNLLGSFLSFRPSMRPWDIYTPVNMMRVSNYRKRTGRAKTDQFVYPRVLRYARHAEMGCHSLIPGTTVDELFAGYEEAKRAGGDFCIATHYWEVDDAIKGVLMRFLDRIEREPGVEFVKAEALFT
jgi:predicted deacetylase